MIHQQQILYVLNHPKLLKSFTQTQSKHFSSNDSEEHQFRHSALDRQSIVGLIKKKTGENNIQLKIKYFQLTWLLAITIQILRKLFFNITLLHQLMLMPHHKSIILIL
ncbi:unnamed protein product [Paramecium primaurelia]|uniref:Uncharacterized protein n=1 Tax=Paramecium primaurelia TaxID=5886 RepID=A0A8S1LJB3_PARPR|nr:unnamed protein product [Paramecium primaurelia]